MMTSGWWERTMLTSFVAPQAFPAELDRVFKITDGILRSLIVNVDE